MAAGEHEVPQSYDAGEEVLLADGEKDAGEKGLALFV